MSKFTTEVRWICETFANSQDEYPETITDTIKAAIPFIFDDSWTTQDEGYKPTLEFKILRHYYTQEIGYETVNLWMLKLNTMLSEIMPKYNALYANLEKYKTILMQGVDVTETQDLTNNQKTKGTSDTTDTSDTTNNANSTQKIDSESNGKQNSTSNNSSDAWQEYADTPQGSLTGLESGRYLTNATHNRGTTDGTTTGTSNATGTNTTTGTSASAGHASGTTNVQSSGTADTTENYVKHIIGKNNGTSYADEYLKLVEGYKDIDQMIIDELQPLFMGLWE